MVTTYDTPVLYNGWILADNNVKYDNTPIIKKSDLVSLTYYVSSNSIIRFYMSSGKELDWEYKSESATKSAYMYICEHILLDPTVIKNSILDEVFIKK